ncbi:MAG: MBL fold metallo-hydrolase [Alphaproteobacteria bacterium]|nr:MBL fold metallo-hydrolase [Alphaproteobacteria bacterium]
MRICIHRGTREIGGTCIEIEAEGSRIALDVGLPLDTPEEGQESLLPAVAGFREPSDSLLGVVISHAHRDHYGLAGYIRPGVPVYIGEDAHNIMKAVSAYVPNGQAFENPRFISHRKPLKIGPFSITPYLVDHSAFDAYSLLVEAEGRRVFYSGDFRAHGRKSGLFEAMIERPPRDIDVLLMEGTTIGRTGTDVGFPTETDLEEEFVRAFRETKGLHLVWASAQNIDRMVTIFRAAKRTGRALLIDLYTAVVLEATGRNNIPQSDWPNVRLYVPYAQRITIKEKGLFGDLAGHKVNRIFPEHLPGLKDRAVMMFRPMMMRDHGLAAVLDGARLSYSMWQGYLDDESTAKARKWLDGRRIPLEVIHTSGHASVADLRRFAAALSPSMLVPIHSFETARFGELFDNVVRREDGAWWEV